MSAGQKALASAANRPGRPARTPQDTARFFPSPSLRPHVWLPVLKLVHLADYGGPYAGSFVPMLLAVLTAGREHVYEPSAVFTDIARGRPWLAVLESAGIPYRFTARADIDATVDEISSEGGSVLHAHFSAFDLACARAARRRRALAFWHIHSPLHRGAKPWARNTVRFGLLSRGVSEIMCVAPQIARGVRRRLGPRGRVTFVPNAIDLTRFPLQGRHEQLGARARLGLPSEGVVLMHFGWDWQRKGGDVYFRAAAELRRGGRDLVAVTVGGEEPARRAAAELGIADVVRVLAPTNQVVDLYAAADVLVMPSRAEGMPFAMAEALSCGRPVVATDAPGEREIAGRLSACRLIPAEPHAIASATAALLDRDASAAGTDAAEARRSLEERLALPRWADRLMGRYAAARASATIR